MTEDLFFDTDCLSSFLWINDTNILQELYGGKIVIPDPVYQEMSNPCIPHIKKRADALLDKNRKLPAVNFTEYRKQMESEKDCQ